VLAPEDNAPLRGSSLDNDSRQPARDFGKALLERRQAEFTSISEIMNDIIPKRSVVERDFHAEF
jgi:hypothetical protein